MNFIPAALVCFTAALLLTGCGERKANVSSPLSYEKAGLTFQYPGNWRIEDDEDIDGIHYLSVETNGDALVIVQMFPMAVAEPLEDYAKMFSKKSAAAMPMGEMTSSKFTALPAANGFTRLQENCGMRVMNQDVPHVRYYLSRDFEGQRCFLLCQVADEDLKKVEAGFEQIAASLKYAPPAESKAR